MWPKKGKKRCMTFRCLGDFTNVEGCSGSSKLMKKWDGFEQNAPSSYYNRFTRWTKTSNLSLLLFVYLRSGCVSVVTMAHSGDQVWSKCAHAFDAAGQ